MPKVASLVASCEQNRKNWESNIEEYQEILESRAGLEGLLMGVEKAIVMERVRRRESKRDSL